MKKVTFKKLRLNGDGSQPTHDATVWTHVDPWGERTFDQEVSFNLGQLDDHGMAGARVIPNDGPKAGLSKGDWFGDFDLPERIDSGDVYQVTIQNVTFVGNITQYNGLKFSFKPVKADIVTDPRDVGVH